MQYVYAMYTKQISTVFALASLIFVTVPATASEPEILEVRETIVFLTGDTCTDAEYLQSRLPNYFVVCAYKTKSFEVEPNVAWARMHYSEFEKYYYVIYVQNKYYQLTPTYSVAGIAFGDHAIAIAADFVIEHERLHLVCQCHKTSDGVHG